MKLKTIIVFILIFCLYGCKQKQATQNILSVKEVREDNKKDCKRIKSFVHSCGSGCALTYSERLISKEGNYYILNFEVEMHINEKLSDNYTESYTLLCSDGKAESMLNDEKEDVFLFEVNNSRYSFKNYADQICSCNYSRNSE